MLPDLDSLSFGQLMKLRYQIDLHLFSHYWPFIVGGLVVVGIAFFVLMRRQ